MLNKVTNGVQFSYEMVQSLRFSENTRNFFDLVSFGSGFVGLRNILNSHYLKDRDISKTYDNFPKWQQNIFKTSDYMGNMSMIISGLRSGPAIAAWNWGAQHLLSKEQLNLFLGYQGYTPIEKIDRSIAMIAFLLRLPSTLKTIYSIYNWTRQHYLNSKKENKIHSYHIPIDAKDAYLTMKTVSVTANQLLHHTPRK